MMPLGLTEGGGERGLAEELAGALRWGTVQVGVRAAEVKQKTGPEHGKGGKFYLLGW